MKLLAILTLGLASMAFAAEEKIEGTAKCAKCHLKTAPECQSVLVVKGKDGKDVTYYVEKNDTGKEFHGEICQEEKAAALEGTVADKGGKKVITITKYTVK